MKYFKYVVLILVLYLSIIVGVIVFNNTKEVNRQVNLKNYKNNIIKNVKERYNSVVKTNKDALIYTLVDGEYIVSGSVYKGRLLSVKDIKISDRTLYFPVSNLDGEYFIYYKDVEKSDTLINNNTRFTNYIPFNENIITSNVTNFYKDGNLIYSFNKSFSLPIYIKDVNTYGVVYNNELLDVKKEEVKEIIYNFNSDKIKAKNIATLLYHFIYNQDTEKCNEIICHKVSLVRTHLDYLKQNNYFTLTMKEFEMFIDKKMNLPKNSILLTLDDGGFAHNAKALFNEYKMNLSMFLVSSWFNPADYKTEYTEVHSHTHNMHNTGVCPKGQGGGLQCLNEKTLMEDLAKSRELTFNTTAISYPFFEFNNYTISVCKKAGFTLGFAGYYGGGSLKAYPGYDKFRIPRITMLNDTSVNDIKNILE
ncbi:MAG: polysaccharide deacetylase family protein [Bacilli bacterium]